MIKKTIQYLIIAAIFAVLLIPTIVGASSTLTDDGYEINWWTVDGGGGVSEGGDYTLKGTIGQPDASTTTEGGNYSLRGGFWVEGILTIYEYLINLPLVLR
jgi:hypothetical protein